MIGIVSADANYGDNVFGDCAYGVACPIVPSGGSSSSTQPSLGGVICSDTQTMIEGNCIENSIIELFSNFSIDVYNKWFGIQPAVLKYVLEVPSEGKTGTNITVRNILLNEGDVAAEIHCINFLDANRNGNFDALELDQSFNKEVEPGQESIVETTVNIPFELEEGHYLIGGICELPAITANAANKIFIQKGAFSKKEGIIFGLSGMTLMLIGAGYYLYQDDKKRKKHIEEQDDN